MEIKKRLSVEEYVDGILKGNRVILSRSITLIESQLDSDQELAEEVISRIMPHSGNSLRIGITGVPGVGKSTFIGRLGKAVIEQGHKMAVLAIDPSSNASGGSILGDKTRMEELANDKRVYIRPSPTGGTLGGVHAKTRETMLVCEAAGFDVVIIETVGVGQSEVSVKEMVDFFLLLMLSGAGDELQGMKKGIMELADLIAITKSDGTNIPQAEKAKNEYLNALHFFPKKENGWEPKVVTCSAIENEGINEIWKMIKFYQFNMGKNGYMESNRANQRVTWFRDHIRFLLERNFYALPSIKNKLNNLLSLVKDGKGSPISMARNLVKEYMKEKD